MYHTSQSNISQFTLQTHHQPSLTLTCCPHYSCHEKSSSFSVLFIFFSITVSFSWTMSQSFIFSLTCSPSCHLPSCLRSWFQRQQTCPTCRMDVLRASNNNNQTPTPAQAPPPAPAAQANGPAVPPANGETLNLKSFLPKVCEKLSPSFLPSFAS